MAGPWERYSTGQVQPVIPVMPDPLAAQRESRTAANEAERIRLAQEAEARAQEANQRAQQELNANLYTKGLRIGANGQPEPIPNWTPPLSIADTPKISASVRQQALAQWNSAQQIDRILADMRDKYAKGPGSTHGIYGALDFNPFSPENQTFNKASDQARGIIRNALGLTGGEANTAAEAQMNLGGYLPRAGNFDSTNVDTFQRLEGLRDNARRQAIQTLGGVPDANGNIKPLAPDQNPFQQTYIGAGPQAQAVPFGGTTAAGGIPDSMQAEHRAYVAAHAGNMDPDAYAAFMVDLNRKYGMQPAPEEGYRQFARDASKPGVTVNPDIPAPSRKMSAVEQIRNSAVNNPLGAGITGFADAASFGVPSALAPDQMSALGDAQGLPMALGQIGGAIAGTKGIGMGMETLARGAPRIAAMGQRMSPFAKSLATDTAYSGVYGGNTGQDPLTSAALGATGSAAGQGFGAGLGAIVRGLRMNPQALALRARGIPMTTGQQLGGLPKSLEDAMTSIPGVGDIVNARRLEGLRAFNQRAFDEAGRPIGAKVQNIGETGVQALTDQIGNSYDNATAGVNVPLDPQFMADMQRVAAMRNSLPPDYAARFDKLGENRISPIVNAGQMTGDAYQQAFRGLKGSRATASGAAPGFEQEYKDAVTSAMDALTGQMKRGGGAQVVSGLSKADQAYRRMKMIEKAIAAAKNGSGSGELQTFTPAQLNSAAQQSANKFGGNRPMRKLIDAGQAVLPSKIPDSGTARRMLTAMAGNAAIGGGTGYAIDGQDGAIKGAALTSLLALGGTKAGQKTLQKLLIDRPEIAKRIGAEIGKRKGLLGTATLPFLIK